MGKYTILTSSNRKQLHVVKTTVASPADGDWDSQDASHSPVFANTIESYWGRLARLETAEVDITDSGTTDVFGIVAQPIVAQSFTNLTGALTRFRVRLNNASSSVDDVSFSLQKGNSTNPDGVVIESLIIPIGDLSASFADFFLDLIKPVPVSSSDIYWIVLNKVGGTGDGIQINIENAGGNLYANGLMVLHDGTDWIPFGGGVDVNFSVWLAGFHIATQESDGQVLYQLSHTLPAF